MRGIIQDAFESLEGLMAISDGVKKCLEQMIADANSAIAYANHLEGDTVILSDGFTEVNKAEWIVETQTEIAQIQAIINRL